MTPKTLIARVKSARDEALAFAGLCDSFIATIEQQELSNLAIEDISKAAHERMKSMNGSSAKEWTLSLFAGSSGGTDEQGNRGNLVDLATARRARAEEKTAESVVVSSGSPNPEGFGGTSVASGGSTDESPREPATRPEGVVSTGGPDRRDEKSRLRILQDRLVGIIDEHEAELRDSINTLGCRGDCYKCPKPNFPTVEEQVEGCLTSVVEGLDLDPSTMVTE
jgi:hypothetical protein